MSSESASGADFDSDTTLRTLHRVQQILGHSFRFPRIVMVGDQSVGKTSVVESLIGADISVKDQAMATRRPLLLTLINTPRGPLHAQFRDGEKMHDLGDIRERIEAENNVTEGDISTNPIELTIFSPDVFDTILIDLPGFIMAPERHQSQELPEQIQRMNSAYMNDPSNILAVVNSATSDPATSMALREAYRADPGGDRSLGIVTKIDLCAKNATSAEGLLRMLRNEVLPLGLGRIGIRCRTHQEQRENIDFPTVIDRESQWIESSGFDRDPEVRLGVPLLRRVLSETLIERVSGELPAIIRRLDAKIAKAKRNEDFLQRLASEPNMRSVAKELEFLVNQLHPSADARSDFEHELRECIGYEVETAMEEAFRSAFYKNSGDKQVWKEVPYTEPTKLVGWGAPGTPSLNVNFDPRSMLLGLKYQPGEGDEDEWRRNLAKFRELFIFGSEANMDGVEQKELDELRSRAVEVGGCASFFRHMLPKHPRRARSHWTRRYNAALDKLIAGDASIAMRASAAGVPTQEGSDTEPTSSEGDSLLRGTHGAVPSDRPDADVSEPGVLSACFEIFMEQLGNFASSKSKSVDPSDGDSSGSKPTKERELAQMYFSFLLDKIATRIHEQQLQGELVGIVERERRPVSDYMQIQNELSKSLEYPRGVSYFETLISSVSSSAQRAEVCMYNEEWTQAYRKVAARRMADDLFRIMSVRLLEPLVFECIQFSLNLFNNNSTVIREAKMATKESQELVQLRNDLSDTYARFQGEDMSDGDD